MKSKTGDLPEDVEEDGPSEINTEGRLEKQSHEKLVLTDRNGVVDETEMNKSKVMNAVVVNGRENKESVKHAGSDTENFLGRDAEEHEDLSEALSKCSLSDKSKKTVNDEEEIVGKILNLRVSENDDLEEKGKFIVIKSSDIKTKEEVDMKKKKDAEDKTANERGPTGGVPSNYCSDQYSQKGPNVDCQQVYNQNPNQRPVHNSGYQQPSQFTYKQNQQGCNSKRGRDDLEEPDYKYLRPVAENQHNLSDPSKSQNLAVSNVISTKGYCGGQVAVQSPEEDIQPLFGGTATSGEFEFILKDKTFLQYSQNIESGGQISQLSNKAQMNNLATVVSQNSYHDQSVINLGPMMDSAGQMKGQESPTSFFEGDGGSEGYGSDNITSPYSEQQDSPGEQSIYYLPPSNSSVDSGTGMPSPGSQLDMCSPRSNMSGFETNMEPCKANSVFGGLHLGSPNANLQQVQNIPRQQFYHPTLTKTDFPVSPPNQAYQSEYNPNNMKGNGGEEFNDYINENLVELKDVMETIAHDMIESEHNKQKKVKNQNVARSHNIIKSPAHGIHSPAHIVQSPPHFVQSPPHGVQSPAYGIQSPPHGVQSPPHGVQSPPHGVQSPPHVVQSPPHIVQSPPHVIQYAQNVQALQDVQNVHHTHNIVPPPSQKAPILPQQKPLSVSQNQKHGRPVANVLPNKVNNMMPATSGQLYFVPQQQQQKTLAPAGKPMTSATQSNVPCQPTVTTSQILVIPGASQPAPPSAIVIVAPPVPQTRKAPQYRPIQPKIHPNPAAVKASPGGESKQASTTPGTKTAPASIPRPGQSASVQPPVVPVQPAQRPRTTNQAAKTNVNQLNIARRLVATMTTDDLKFTDKDGDTFLHVAVCKADKYMVQALLERLVRENLQSMIDTQNNERQTPVYLAVSANQPDMVEMFNKYGADVNLLAERISPNGQKEIKAAIHSASSNGREYLQTLKELLNAPDLNLNMFNSDGCTALHCAILEHNQPRLPVDGVRDTTLDLKTDSRPIIEALIKAGADPNAQDKKSGKTAFMYALETRDYTLVETLLKLVDNTKIRSYFRTQAFDGSTCVKIMESRKSEFPLNLYEKLSAMMSNSKSLSYQRRVIDVA